MGGKKTNKFGRAILKFSISFKVNVSTNPHSITQNNPYLAERVIGQRSNNFHLKIYHSYLLLSPSNAPSVHLASGVTYTWSVVA